MVGCIPKYLVRGSSFHLQRPGLDTAQLVKQGPHQQPFQALCPCPHPHPRPSPHTPHLLGPCCRASARCFCPEVLWASTEDGAPLRLWSSRVPGEPCPVRWDHDWDTSLLLVPFASEELTSQRRKCNQHRCFPGRGLPSLTDAWSLQEPHGWRPIEGGRTGPPRGRGPPHGRGLHVAGASTWQGALVTAGAGCQFLLILTHFYL